MLQCPQILFPVDFSNRCASAVPSVRAMAARLGSKVTLLHVVFVPLTWSETGARFEMAEASLYPRTPDMERLKETSLSTLAEFAEREFGDMRPKVAVEIGDAAMNITEYAERSGAGMIMMPTHGCGFFRRYLLGSVTAKVLHDAGRPVWTDSHAGEPVSGHSGSIQSVLCAIGLDQASVEAIRWAAEFAANSNARLTVIHVVHTPESTPAGGYTAFRDLLLAHAKDEMAPLIKQAGVEAGTWAGGGPVAETIKIAAELFHADAVVIGRGHLPHTLGGLRTHAYSIIRESPCPVIRM